MVQWIGHRGMGNHAPENTLKGIQTAYEMGVRWVEVDVQLTKDGIAVLHHDDDLQRCCGQQGMLSSWDWQSLKNLDFGYSKKFGNRFLNTPIPQLVDILSWIDQKGMGINLELKLSEGLKTEQIEMLCQQVKQTLELFPRLGKERVVLSSFSLEALRIMQHSYPEGRYGVCIEDPQDFLKALDQLTLWSAHFQWDLLTPSWMEFCRKNGLVVWIWTLNDPKLYNYYLTMGVEGIITDDFPAFAPVIVNTY